MTRLNIISNIRDFQALPVDLQRAINGTIFNPHGLRFVARIRKAERKIAIQNAVAKAISDQAITEKLGIEILKANNAYGPKGKLAIDSIKKG